MPLTKEQELVITILAALRSQGAEIYITLETYNILTYIIRNPPITKAIIANVDVLYPTELFKKWLKQITETTTLRKEDAKILAYGSFGTSLSSTILGIDKILTLDKCLQAEFSQKKSELAEKLKTLTKTLPKPCEKAKLPDVILLTI